MTYLVQSEIAGSMSMLSRISQCAAQQSIPDSDMWASTNRRTWAASPGWDEAWASAKVSHEDNPVYDPGADEAVITDMMILSQVQSMMPVSDPAAEFVPEPTP